MHPEQLAAALASANALLQAHPLATPRVASADPDALVAEVIHVEWPPPHRPPFGRLRFLEPAYVQMPLVLTWGMSLHVFAGDALKLLPSLPRAAIEPGAHVFMWRELDA